MCTSFKKDQDELSKSPFEIFPNPSNGTIYVKHAKPANETYNVIASNAFGKDVFRGTFNSSINNNQIIELKNITPGIYTLQLRSKKDSYSERIIIGE
jgi:hypothetical protein